MKRTLLIGLIISLFLVFSPINLYAKNGKSHAVDMAIVLGVYSSENNKSNNNLDAIWPLLELINLMIDDSHTEEYYEDTERQQSYSLPVYSDFNPSSYYTLGSNNKEYGVLKTTYNFSWGEYGHRLMFHWGFDDKKPINESALKTALQRKNIDMNNEESSLLIEYIQQLQRKRMNQMRSAVNDFFYLGGSRERTRGIAGILYYIHLIGDHIECANDMTSEAVLTIDSIQKNLIPLIKDLENSDSGSLARKAQNDIATLYNKMEELNKSPSIGKDYAQELLNLLYKFLPSTMEFWLSPSSKKRGFSFVN